MQRKSDMSASEERPLRVLAADDSAGMRSVLWKLVLLQKEDRSSELPGMDLCGIARDGVECLEQVKQLRPDVLVLDLEMPRLNGLEVLDRLRREDSELPVIMCSAYTEHGARSTLEALARGASDYVTKPAGQRNFDAAMLSLSQQLLTRIATLARDARGEEKKAATSPSSNSSQSARPEEIAPKASTPIEVVVIGLSTGGPAPFGPLLSQLPEKFSRPGRNRCCRSCRKIFPCRC